MLTVFITLHSFPTLANDFPNARAEGEAEVQGHRYASGTPWSSALPTPPPPQCWRYKIPPLTLVHWPPRLKLDQSDSFTDFRTEAEIQEDGPGHLQGIIVHLICR